MEKTNFLKFSELMTNYSSKSLRNLCGFFKNIFDAICSPYNFSFLFWSIIPKLILLPVLFSRIFFLSDNVYVCIPDDLYFCVFYLYVPLVPNYLVLANKLHLILYYIYLLFKYHLITAVFLSLFDL